MWPYGHNKCSSCSGKGHVRETRSIQREVRCSNCNGRGKSYAPGVDECPWCNGKGSVFKDFEEEYYVPCGDCASSGKITCDACCGQGKVTCNKCTGSGKVECGRCCGLRRVLSYTTVEVTEEPSSAASQYVCPSLPKFTKGDNPLSNLKGKTVFTQDETARIDHLGFRSQPAAAVLSSEVDLCRASHTGYTLRQRIEIEACSLVEYHYRHEGKEYSIWINPEHGLVEDLDGPIQSYIANVDALAEKAFKEKRYEDAYRFISRGLCMDETTDAEKKLRDQTLQGLVASYRTIALVSWIGAAIVWWLVGRLLPNLQNSLLFVLGLIPLFVGVQLFAPDCGVRFSGPKDRVLPASLLGVVAFLAGAGIGEGTSWTDWIGLALLIIATVAFGLIRSNTRALHAKLEAHRASFPSPQILETYILKFDPKPELLSRTVRALALVVALLAIQPILLVASGVNKWALDRTGIHFDLRVDGMPPGAVGVTWTPPEAQFNGKAIHSGDKLPPGKGVLEVTDIHWMPFRREIAVAYGRITNVGTIELESSKGSLSVAVNPSPATVIVKRDGEVVSQGNAPLKLDNLPVGKYLLAIRRGEYEESHEVKIQRLELTEARIDLDLGSADLSSDPADAEFELSGNGRAWHGKLPIRIDDMPVGTYQLITRRGEYEESSTVEIERQQQTKANIELNLGSAKLSSDPPDAEFELSGNGRHWQGKLPAAIADIPGGNYTLAVTRNGWEQTDRISINRGSITTNKMEFHYGSIEVTSDPTGLAVSTNGIEIGKTPITVRKLRPGRYIVTAMDGDNDLTAEIPVAPREAAKHTFIFHYGTVQLASIPTGATVIHKGKEIGKTPLTLSRIPAGETIVELRLEDYVSTNLSIIAVEGATNQLSAQLIGERYLQAMNQARETFGAGQFAQSREFLATALVIQPDDPAATQLRDEIAKAAAKAEEAMQAEQASAKARELASLMSLDFARVIGECTDTRIVQHPVVMNDGYYDQRGKFIVTGQHTEMHNTTEPTFNDARFAAKYIGKTYKFDSAGWKIAKIEKDGTVVFRSGSGKLLEFGQVEIRAIPSAASQGEFLLLKDSQRITIRARIGRHDRGDLFSRVLHRIYLEDAELFTQ